MAKSYPRARRARIVQARYRMVHRVLDRTYVCRSFSNLLVISLLSSFLFTFASLTFASPAHAVQFWPFKKSNSADTQFREYSDTELLKLATQPDADFSFIRPNETTPFEMKRITEVATKGIYLGVGTERGFIALALNEMVERAVFFDRNPSVVLYNRINVKLLQLAQNHQDYVWLRKTAPYQEIKARSSENGRALTVQEFKWFRSLTEGSRDTLADSYVIARDANYVTNSELGERLISLAKRNLISSSVLDITDQKSVDFFVSQKLTGTTL
ncbi:MAG: hypothetical protein RBT63_03975, partial [Bdellovibrionales bacterium]|nr:hypothetical protein [Bdellovibrionales bacterium]